MFEKIDGALSKEDDARVVHGFEGFDRDFQKDQQEPCIASVLRVEVLAQIGGNPLNAPKNNVHLFLWKSGCLASCAKGGDT